MVRQENMHDLPERQVAYGESFGRGVLQIPAGTEHKK